MVSEHSHWTTIDKTSKIFQCQYHAQAFLLTRVVGQLSWIEGMTVKADDACVVIRWSAWISLREHRSCAIQTRISMEFEGKTEVRMMQDWVRSDNVDQLHE